MKEVTPTPPERLPAEPEAPWAMVIMAGGAGERFWPVSNRRSPKQLLRMKPTADQPEQSLLAMAFDRARRIVPADRVYIVAGEALRGAIEGALPDLTPGNIILEPEARNTAPCLALAAAELERRLGHDVVMGVLTADHLIEAGEAFDATIRTAMRHATGSRDLVTLGIEPTRAETGYGYLELGEKLYEPEGDSNAADAQAPPVYRVVKFTEKPDAATAEAFVAAGRYFWNSGMFFWSVAALFEAFERYQPEMAHEIDRLRGTGAEGPSSRVVSDVYGSLKPTPIDVAILEKAENVVAVRAKFWWEDVGSWDAIARVTPADERGNVVIGPALAIDASSNLVYNDAGGEGASQQIVLLGVEDLVVVRSDRAILVMPKHRAQQVKEVVRLLREQGRDDLL